MLAVPGPAPYGTPAAIVATTKWPTTATWNTAQQPAANPTTYVPADGGSPQPTTATVPNVPTTTAAPQPTTTVVTQPSAPAGGAALYGQCGGSGYSGPTTCAQGTCTKLNGEWAPSPRFEKDEPDLWVCNRLVLSVHSLSELTSIYINLRIVRPPESTIISSDLEAEKGHSQTQTRFC